MGVFISADTLVPSPLAPQMFNRYAYVGGNPLLFVDPSGHLKLCGAACEDGYNWSPSKGGGGGGAAPLDAGRKPGKTVKTRNGSAPKLPVIKLPAPPRVEQGQTVWPGGKYGHGVFAWGEPPIDIYVPPTVWFFPSSPGYYPIYRPAELVYVEAGAYRDEYWGGDDWPARSPAQLQNPVIPGTWQTARQYTAEQMPNDAQVLAGFFGSMNNGLESDPPSWDEPIVARGVDALQMLAYGSQGALNSFRYNNRFNLQVNAAGELRVIIMQRRYEAEQWFYVGFGIARPVTPWPGGELKPR